MHIQRQQMNDICRRAHAFDLAVAIGGPSVSACPDYYPSFDYLHVGELGDATDELIARLARDPSRPAQQVVLEDRRSRSPMTEFPIPAYELAEVKKYFLGSIQYSSGCPYQCEFCDIPGLYGRNPRLKTPQQIIAELDKLRECGVTGTVYFVDDNFIGNRKAALDLLPHLIEWQKKTGYVMRLACEATLNIAKRPEILEKMREAFFVTIFCGIETPDPDALKAMHKDHNMMVPILEGVHTINSYGMEVVSGIIMGLDTDKPETGEALARLCRGIQDSAVDDQSAAGAAEDAAMGSPGAREPADPRRKPAIRMSISCCPTIRSSVPGANAWRSPTSRKSSTRAISIRCDYTYANRLKVPVSPEQKSWANIKRGLIMLRNIFWKVGVLGDYRKVFWKFALAAPAARRHRGPDRLGDDRASFDHVRARGFERPAERLELFAPAARGIGSCRVSANENAARRRPVR